MPLSYLYCCIITEPALQQLSLQQPLCMHRTVSQPAGCTHHSHGCICARPQPYGYTHVLLNQQHDCTCVLRSGDCIYARHFHGCIYARRSHDCTCASPQLLYIYDPHRGCKRALQL